MGNSSVYIGTSGWEYKHWENVFYPKENGSVTKLNYYANELSSVEINSSFYRLPTEKILKNWVKEVPSTFIFAVKASRYITHIKKLKDPKESTDELFKRIEVLGEKLGPILFQLPPSWKCNKNRLDELLKILPKKYRYAFEFRNKTWITKEILALLREYNAAFCIYEIDKWLSPKEITSDFVYIRLHGPQKAYKGNYSSKNLAGWAGAFASWRKKNLDIYCYFDNDEKGYAPHNALCLKKMIEK